MMHSDVIMHSASSALLHICFVYILNEYCNFAHVVGAVAEKFEDLMVSGNLEYNGSGTMPQGLTHSDAFTNAGPFTAVFTTVTQLFTSLSIVCPALIIISVIIRQPRLSNHRYWFIINLLVSNILVAILFLPATINTAAHMFTDHEAASMEFIVGYALIPPVAYCLVSCVILTDMFCFLFFGNYQQFLTSKKAIVMVKIPWIMSCVFVVLLSIQKSVELLSNHIILLITVAFMLIVKIIIGVAVLFLNVFLFYYWAKVNIRLQAEVFNLPTAQSKCRLHKQINIFVRVESCIKPFFAFFSISLFGVAIEIMKGILAVSACGFHHAPVSFVIFIVLTWVECMFCVLTYAILLMIIFRYACFKNNKIFPA